MRIPEKSNKDTIVIIGCLMFIVGLFVFMQKYENAQFHKEVNPRMFAQTGKAQPAARGVASLDEAR